MRISHLTLRGFRCFDGLGQTIELGSLSCFVGPNAAGKTSTMTALARMFGESRLLRQILPSDFHLEPNEKLHDKASRRLQIECRIDFPELESETEKFGNAIPETFNQMIIAAPGQNPYCRVRLDALWTNDGTLSGDIQQDLWWLPTDSNDENTIENHRRKFQVSDRSRIRVIYIPAARDPQHQIRTTTETSFGRLLEALSWDTKQETMLKEKLGELQQLLSAITGVKTIEQSIQLQWSGLYKGKSAQNVLLQAVEQDPIGLLSQLAPMFLPDENGRPLTTHGLSDGLRSLFSLALSIGLFQVERKISADANAAGFKHEAGERLPFLTIFAVEEPENHLSPHYLGRVVTALESVARTHDAQVILSSHSPAILGRVSPEDVRYFLGHDGAAASRVKKLPLPEDKSDEAFKFVREAVRGHPELYFSRLVVLGEGASEEVVLRRLFEAHGTSLDTNFISVVPLGGRHVNHFWRLLHGLEIPYLTLLDLDREKAGAGWGRVQYIRDQLVQLHGRGSALLRFPNGKQECHLDDAAWDNLASRDPADGIRLNTWLTLFEQRYDVFFCSPLDLDFCMLQAFPDIYQSLAPKGGGPRLPERNSPEYATAVANRVQQVLGSGEEKVKDDPIGRTYTAEEKDHFPWYKYFFIDNSKPVTHMRALILISDAQLREAAPSALIKLIHKARTTVST